MNIKIIYTALFIFIVAVCRAHAQSEDFCDAVTTIIRDAPNRFTNIKGKILSDDNMAIIWDCGVKAPGAIASRFVLANGLFYEGAFFQTVRKEEIPAAYDKYKKMLEGCLLSQKYTEMKQDNFYPGLSEYKKLAFMPDLPEDTKISMAPAHVTMETTYSKDIGKYTIVIYIFEH